MATLKYDYTFAADAENNTAASVARLAMLGGTDVLDIGGGPAIVARHLVTQGRTATCIDNDREAIASLEGTGVRGIEADLESTDWADGVAGEQFDVIILADVLEHLRRPADVLEGIVRGSLLREDGILVVSVPNASHISVISELLAGEFDYTKTGILDETHVRWFTLHSLTRLLESAGFVVDRVERTRRTLEQTDSAVHAMTIRDDVRREMAEQNPELDTYQLVVLARPDNAANRIAADRARFIEERKVWREEREEWRRERDALREQLDRLNTLGAAEVETLEASHKLESETLRGELARIAALLEREREVTRAEFLAGADEIAYYRGRITALQADLARARRNVGRQRAELKRLRASSSLMEQSRGVRAAAKAVRAARRVRDRRA